MEIKQIARRFLLAAVMLGSGNAFAGPAANFDGGAMFGDRDTNGWRFSVTADIVVSHLGVWDEGADGLESLVDVGLWHDDGTLIASVVVPDDTTPLLIDSTRYIELGTPLHLMSGEFYRVGASARTGDLTWMFNATTVTTHPGVVFDAGYYADVDTNTLTFPGQRFDAFPNSIFGANFLVPVPGGLPLMLVALAGLVLVRGRDAGSLRIAALSQAPRGH